MDGWMDEHCCRCRKKAYKKQSIGRSGGVGRARKHARKRGVEPTGTIRNCAPWGRGKGRPALVSPACCVEDSRSRGAAGSVVPHATARRGGPSSGQNGRGWWVGMPRGRMGWDGMGWFGRCFGRFRGGRAGRGVACEGAGGSGCHVDGKGIVAWVPCGVGHVWYDRLAAAACWGGAPTTRPAGVRAARPLVDPARRPSTSATRGGFWLLLGEMQMRRRFRFGLHSTDLLFFVICRMVWLLNDVYDVEHRAYLMSEKKMELTPLKIRSHGTSTVMQYDERYTPYIEMTGLLSFIQLVSQSTPTLNVAAVTALIDRWRPETHSFHLRIGEMAVTLQDVSMITALPIEGKPLCMSTDFEGWRQQMEALIGMSPPEPEVEDGGKKDRVPAGAPFTWIAANFAHCPEDANDEVIQRYARVYMWYVISRTIFADGTGKNAPWMWLKALTVFDNKFTWGSAALATLYRQVINC
ncbi:uncharacterized protein LOC123397037 [Hordeum vulgare subsp. vulgare]|uniref:uncharacterized protein LOC123397037 n=1 Tax=Hordeum vulgare subsp. vulgare TaxID=112509 RepID=UPI001D1A55B8|nr:uncharacterized protein LOC123397037 [Hordeum vulgare subsp. vulgare]